MFDNLRRRSSSPTNLLDIIGEVRTRWRTKLALRGALAVAGIGFGPFPLAPYGLGGAGFSGASIIAARVAMLLFLAAAGYWFLWVPLRRRVTDEQGAMYLEENEPSLQATLLSAVEASPHGHIPGAPALAPPTLPRGLRRRRARRAAGARAWSRVPPQCYVGDVAVVLGRRGRVAVSHRGQAGQHHGPERCGPDRLREAARIRFRRRDAARAAD